MVKIIYLDASNTRVGKCEHLLGKFLDDSAYDLLIDEDTDVYKPLGPGDGDVRDERNILLKFRKGVIPQKMAREGYDLLETGATMSDNRGVAAGTDRDELQKMPGGHGSRKWVTKRQKVVLDYFISGSPKSLTGGDRLQELIDETSDEPLEGRGTGGVVQYNNLFNVKAGATWLNKTPKDFVFSDWTESIRECSPEERKQKALDLAQKYLTNTTYGNGVLSGVAGSMDRYPRIPFCRQTGWTVANNEKYEAAIPLFEKCASIYKKNLPIRYEQQRLYGQHIDKHFMVGDTPYTTITINKSFRTACHRDAGDLCDPGVPGKTPRGFSNLTVVTNGKKFDGFYLCFPEYRAAVNIQPGDIIMMDAHQIHGNTPAKEHEEGFERLSLVLYTREPMVDCGSYAYEETRKNFTYSRRLNKEHSLWHEGWNGISPGMWESEDWGNYLALNGFPEEAEKILNKGSSLDKFF
jgi:hypothetical protein